MRLYVPQNDVPGRRRQAWCSSPPYCLRQGCGSCCQPAGTREHAHSSHHDVGRLLLPPAQAPAGLFAGRHDALQVQETRGVGPADLLLNPLLGDLPAPGAEDEGVAEDGPDASVGHVEVVGGVVEEHVGRHGLVDGVVEDPDRLAAQAWARGVLGAVAGVLDRDVPQRPKHAELRDRVRVPVVPGIHRPIQDAAAPHHVRRDRRLVRGDDIPNPGHVLHAVDLRRQRRLNEGVVGRAAVAVRAAEEREEDGPSAAGHVRASARLVGRM
mmetsp:Transcript_4622/g.14848  ORF Transcript_4622/g.14848 Transcript_4622/m.14848 type:complete len:268 (-) Transcript_4622:58-861(-)